MEKRKFKLKKDSPFIELVKVLKSEGLSETGGHGKSMIEEGQVSVNGEEEFRVRRKLYNGDVVAVEDVEIEIVS
ncbi:MAG: RNA-binding S4 domain-containing protein [Crocinitomicaceae bacterium]|jgi:ribosome-associated protein|nr:RNA-binding S4 domain-containing protein [Crocinitomicaceae bacterium]MBK9591248.1 RNA-binding S4 domain-containing protein [Crocinitomicaceae bacterium]